jgi:hypothetical protein
MKMKVVVYVVCHDEESRKEAEAAWAAFPWATVTVLPDTPATSPYMEGAAFLTVLPEKRHEWEDADFVGVLSWRALEKINVPPTFLDDLEDLTKQQDAGVVALLPSTEPLIAKALNSHPRFLEVWVPLLLELGFSVADAVSSKPLSFMCNYWLARPAWMEAYLCFYARMAHVLGTEESLRDALRSDSGYPTSLSAARLTHIYGTPHMQYHPFVGERMPCFFFWKMDACVAVMPLAKWYGIWEGKEWALQVAKMEGRDAEEDMEPGTFFEMLQRWRRVDPASQK